MADFNAYFLFEDEINGRTSRSYDGVFADYATAKTAYDNLKADLEAASGATIIVGRLSEVEIDNAAPTAGARVFEVAHATVSLVGKSQKAAFELPAPLGALFSGNSLIFTAASPFDDVIQNFVTGAGWTISDGDAVDEVVSGKRQYNASGKTNLPT